MPAIFVLDRRYSFAFNGSGNDHNRLTLCVDSLVIGLNNLRQGMAVNDDGLPAEGIKLRS